MHYLKSITAINKVYASKGSQPVRVLCDDMEEYVCKYNTHPGRTANKLFREYIGASFLTYWKLATPDFAFIEILEEHIGDFQQLQPAFFKTICFGSRFNRSYKEVDKFLSLMKAKDRKLFPERHEFLKIALFDIWMSNEDRHYNNFNLLLDLDNANRFIPIDQEMIFNTGNLNRGLYLISENESIVNTPLTKALFLNKELKDRKYLTKLKEEYYFCINECKKNIDVVLETIPDDWLINTGVEKEMLLKELFNPKWVKDVYIEFLRFIQIIAK